EGDGDCPGGVGHRVEGPDDRGVDVPGHADDVEVGEHRHAVDRHVELALPRFENCLVDLGEVQAHHVGHVGGQPRDRVGEGAVVAGGGAAGLVARHRRRVEVLAGVNGGGRWHGRAVAEIGVGRVPQHAVAARVDLHGGDVPQQVHGPAG